LRQAFSLYNTGDAARGFRNGYVARVEAAASSADAGSPRQAPAPPPWAVFVATQTTAGFVISPIPTSEGADR
jgi:type IV secretion system protein VirB1